MIVLRVASRNAGSEKRVTKLPGPTKRGVPMPAHSVQLRTVTAAKSAKNIVTSNSAGSRYRVT